MTQITPGGVTPGGSETPACFQITKADKLSNSSGTKKLRVDLVSLFGAKQALPYEKGGNSLDKAYHLSIALQDDKIYDAPPSKGLFGRGVVVELPLEEAEVVPAAALAAPEEGGRAAEEPEAAPAKQYIVLNVNSLAKRLGVTPDEIKEKEREGSIVFNNYIQENLKKISTEQDLVSQLILDAKKLIENGEPPSRALNSDQKSAFTNFIQSHFKGSYLHQNAENFLGWLETEDSTKNHETEIKTFLAHLETKVWWRSEVLKGAPQPKINSFYIGSGIAHSGKEGRVTERMRYLDWDSKGRYAVAGKKAENPEGMDPSSKPNSNEIFISSSGYDSIVVGTLNKNSLKRRLGITDAELKLAQRTEKDEPQNTFKVDFLIDQKVQTIDRFNTFFHSFIGDEGRLASMPPEAFIEVLNGCIAQHPDGEVRAVLQETKERMGKIASTSSSLEEELVVTTRGKSIEPKTVLTEVKRLTSKLEEIGAISEEKPLDKIKAEEDNPSAIAFSGETLTQTKCDTSEIKIVEGALRVLGDAGAKPLSGGFFETGHEGKVLPRLSLLPETSDPEGRYAIAFQGKVYPHKPVGYPDKWAPMMLLTGHYQPAWVLVNVHSLGRLGLSSKEIAKAEKENTLHYLVESRFSKIMEFNRDFYTNEKKLSYVSMINILETLLSETLENQTTRSIAHPDPEVKKAIESTLKEAEKYVKERENRGPELATEPELEDSGSESEELFFDWEPKKIPVDEQTKLMMKNLKTKLIKLGAVSAQEPKAKTFEEWQGDLLPFEDSGEELFPY